jgi:C-3',4' desaturase CrtD
MSYEVVVVGAGIGGLTTAALLAARGVKVCLLEKASQPGGCAAPFEKFGYTFESGAGLYALWQPGEIHDRIFSELPVDPPEVRRIEPSYIVRLPDQSDIAIKSDSESFNHELRSGFPECPDEAIAFYRDAGVIGNALLRAASRVPDLRTAGRWRRLHAFLPDASLAARIRSLIDHTTQQHLAGTSFRFRRFIDAQLQMFAQCGAEECAYLYACVALTLARHGLFALRGGAAALANRLIQSIKESGAIVRLDTTALRLAYDASGEAIGVDLLSGETLTASRAIVSNMTIWDTYGKLVGFNRTPSASRKRLKSLRGWGAYLLYLGIDEPVAQELAADHILAITDLQRGQVYDPAAMQLTLASAPVWDPRGPEGKRAATVHMFTDVDQWFTFHEDETEHEEKDQAALESLWRRLHSSITELSDSVEVIETATPRTCYELTRRKLGMVGGVGQSLAVFGLNSVSHRTFMPNVFMVGDTTFPGAGVAAVSHSALIVANEIAPRRT